MPQEDESTVLNLIVCVFFWSYVPFQKWIFPSHVVVTHSRANKGGGRFKSDELVLVMCHPVPPAESIKWVRNSLVLKSLESKKDIVKLKNKGIVMHYTITVRCTGFGNKKPEFAAPALFTQGSSSRTVPYHSSLPGKACGHWSR